MLKQSLRLVAAFGLLAVVASCGCADRDTPTARDTVVVGVRSDVSSFNIYTATNAFSQEIADILFLPLGRESLAADGGPPRFEPGLAESWHWDDDRTLVVQLHPNARWSDGRAVTTEDVLFSHAAATDEAVGWFGADVKSLIDRVEASGEHTLTFRFVSAYPFAVMDAFEGNVVPAHVYADPPRAEWATASFLDAPVVSGPFLLERYERGALLELKKNPRCHLPPAKLERVVFRIVPDETTLVNELLAGGIDVMANVRGDAIDRIQAAKDVSLVRAEDLSYAFVAWNTGRPALSDSAVRRALTMAIDRDSLMKALAPRTGRPGSSPVPSPLWAHDASIQAHPHDPAAASALLAKAGWTDRDSTGLLRNRAGESLSIELETNRESSLRTQIAEAVADQLRRIGVDASVRTYEFGTSLERRARHEFDAFVSTWRESTKADLRSVFHSDAIAQGYNYGQFRNAELDGVLDALTGETDSQSAKKLWSRAQQILHDEQPYTVLFELDRLHAVRDGLGGFQPTPRSAYYGIETWHWAD